MGLILQRKNNSHLPGSAAHPPLIVGFTETRSHHRSCAAAPKGHFHNLNHLKRSLVDELSAGDRAGEGSRGL